MGLRCTGNDKKNQAIKMVLLKMSGTRLKWPCWWK